MRTLVHGVLLSLLGLALYKWAIHTFPPYIVVYPSPYAYHVQYQHGIHWTGIPRLEIYLNGAQFARWAVRRSLEASLFYVCVMAWMAEVRDVSVKNLEELHHRRPQDDGRIWGTR